VVSGASGWIGKNLGCALDAKDMPWVGLTRGALAATQATQWLPVGDDFNDIETAFPKDAGAVVHLAARVHQMREDPKDALARYRLTNRDATIRIARAAKAAGVTRFVFLSSIKALGEVEPGRPYRETDTASPTDPYGISKLEAEEALHAMKSTSFNPTIVRIPLVYGAGVGANFAKLANAVARGVPLPLGMANAKRSLLGMDNLLDALITCLVHPSAPGETFHVADGETPSVRELVIAIGDAVGHAPRLVPIPMAWLKLAGMLTSKEESVMRLTSPLRVDIRHIKAALDWTPKTTLVAGLARAFDGTKQR
jgi:UDP-glucose 4-epimerase